MKTRYIYLVIGLIFVNCQEPQPELILKFSDKPVLINCNIEYSELFNEAIYNFEYNLTENYANKNPNLSYAYRLFIKESTTNTVNYNNISNQHSLDVFEALKNVEGLWSEKNNKLLPNYNHEIYSCIGANIKDEDIKATYNALLSTSSLNMRMLKDVLMDKSSRLNTDKYLATYVALELYYSKLSNVDLSMKEAKPIDTKYKEENDPHAGHSHD